MKARKIVFSIFKGCLTLGLLLIIATFIYKMCIKTYDFGYRIFAEDPMSPPPGYTTSVAIVDGKSVMEIGEILEERGLIRDAYIFYLQELVSDYHGMLTPGIYELSTAMTPNEMMAIMAANYSEDGEIEDDSVAGPNEYYDGSLSDGNADGMADEFQDNIVDSDPTDYMDGYQ